MNWNMIGHQWAVDLLSEHILLGNLRHAYLITGPKGVGRRTLAVRMAQALACTHPPTPGQPCLVCSACQRLERMQHPDLSVVQAEAPGAILKVERIRELQHTLSLTPYEARFRLGLLLRFEEANDNAQNALLKTLEEPSPQAILIITAESAESLKPTIVSRCEIIRLRPVGVEELGKKLIEFKSISAERALQLAHISSGRPGYAMALHENQELLDQREGWIEDIWRMIGANRVERFTYAITQTKDAEKETLLNILIVWISFWHDILLCCCGSEAPITNLQWNVEIEALARQVNRQAAHQAIRALENSMNRLRRNVNARLTFEILLLDLPRLHAGK